MAKADTQRVSKVWFVRRVRHWGPTAAVRGCTGQAWGIAPCKWKTARQGGAGRDKIEEAAHKLKDWDPSKRKQDISPHLLRIQIPVGREGEGDPGVLT